jgi:hypothetical protein
MLKILQIIIQIKLFFFTKNIKISINYIQKRYL